MFAKRITGKFTEPGHEIFVWGAGVIGRRVLPYIGESNVSAFIDSDTKKIGTKFCGKPVISFEEYLEKYNGRFIIITPYLEYEIEDFLKEKDIDCYFRLSDCAYELSTGNINDILKKRIIKDLSDIHSSAIYGASLYSIIMDEWIKEYAGQYLPIIVPNRVMKKYMYKVIEEFPKIEFLPEEVVRSKNIETLLVAEEWHIPRLKVQCPRIRIINEFDISEREEQYFSKGLLKIKNSHIGENCFIVGLGPSLQVEKLNWLKDNGISSFSVNSVFMIYDKTYWRPTYYVVGDTYFYAEESWFKPEEYSEKLSFISDQDRDVFWSRHKNKKIIKYHVTRNMPRREPTSFSDHVENCVYHGGTVAYDTLQIAIHMGFSNIYLIGIDGFDPTTKDRSYKHIYDIEKESDGGQGFTYQVNRAFNSARKFAVEHGVHIYNATDGGYIENFDRVDFGSLFTDGRFTPEKAVVHPREPWYESDEK